jgi:Ran GTPase-activating protein (RanGAP) involved in mRNA processing and transport
VVNLRTLSLRGNALCPTALEFLRTGLTNGSLTNLRTLDLRENELGDDGADKIAHMMVVDVFATISVLRLQRYDMPP